MLLFVDLLAGTLQSYAVLCMWILLSFLVLSRVHLPDLPCRCLSTAMVVSWCLLAHHPMRFLQLVGVLEMCYSTFGKRAAPASAKACNKRPTAVADPIPESDAAEWDPHQHDVYLRRLLVENPNATEPAVISMIQRDHGIIVAAHSLLRRHLQSVRSTHLSREQLSEFYIECVQQQMATGMTGQTLHKWFLETTSMKCAQKTSVRWLADVPSGAMSSVPIPDDCLGDAAFADWELTLWEIFIAHPFVGAPAMAALLEPRTGKVHVPMLETWLVRTRTTKLDRVVWSPVKSWYDKEILFHEVCY